jgi:hypothetical protein
MRPIRLATLATAAVALIALTGCYSIESESTAQLDVIGNVQITTTTCLDQPPGVPNCPASNYEPGSPQTITNYLIAYRVPDGTTAPDSFSATSGDAFTYTKDQSYADALTAAIPPPSGQHWVGYRTQKNPATPTGTQTFNPTFGLPKSSDGTPFHGPFKYRTVVGFIDDQSANGNDPVQCANPPTDLSSANTNGTQSVCLDYPDAATAAQDQDIPTRDLGITSGNPASVTQNASATLPFTALYAGAADPSASFDISVSSDAPSGVTLTPSTTKITPDSDSSTPITVKADVAPTVPVGTYNVTLTAKASSGQTRQATGKLVVGLGKPVNLALPFISGTDAVGQTAACSNGDWSSSPAKFAFQWTRDGNDIAGASAASYTLTEDDGATLVACRVTATNDAGDGTATSGPIRVAQEGGADVTLDGKVSVKPDSDGTYTVDPGITVSCPPRLPANCGGGGSITATAATGSVHSAAVARVAHRGFAAKSGAQTKLIMHLTHAGSKLLRLRKKLTLVVTVVTRNHKLERVSSKKQFTIKVPR